jgi:two-component system, response regulator YesN
MIKTMIVDDEYLIRQLIIKSVDWTSLGFEIIGEAENGREALEYINKWSPDLVLIDINIPFINGIELSHIINQKHPYIKMVILTAYSDFDYARSAIKAGVVEYLLKPVDAQPLEKALIAIREGILAEKRQRQYINKLENQVTRYRSDSKDTVLKAIICGRKIEEEAFDSIRNTINVKGEKIYTIVLEVDNYFKNWTSNADRELWKFCVLNITYEIISGECNCEIIEMEENKIAVLADWPDTVDYLTDLCDKVTEVVRQCLNFTVTVGLSRRHTGVRDCRITYKEAVKALERKFFEGCGRVFVYDDMDYTSDEDISQYIQNKEDILILLRLGNLQDVHVRINRILDDAMKNRIGKNSIIHIMENYIYLAISFMKEINSDVNEINSYQKYYMDSLNHSETISNIKENMSELFDRIQNSIKGNTNFKSLKIVENAKVYIEENYTRDELSLAEIAEKLYVNASYLSKIFKEQTKYSIIEYLISYRLNKAKEHMDRYRDIPIYEVANKVGYSDPLYFGKSFKKKYGLSPQRYLKQKYSNKQ